MTSSNTGAMLLWSHALWARSIYWVHIFPCSEMMWSLYELTHIWSAIVDEREEWPFWRMIILSNCLNWKIFCDDHSSLLSTTAVQIRICSHILHVISLLTERYELNKLTSLPMWGFIAQLVDHRTGIRGGQGFESRWSPGIFLSFSFPIA